MSPGDRVWWTDDNGDTREGTLVAIVNEAHPTAVLDLRRMVPLERVRERGVGELLDGGRVLYSAAWRFCSVLSRSREMAPA